MLKNEYEGLAMSPDHQNEKKAVEYTEESWYKKEGDREISQEEYGNSKE